MPGTRDLHQLEHFVDVVECGNFSAAARRHGVSSVAISKSIRALEDALQTRLFERTTRAVTLTDEGRALYAEVASPLRTVRDATQRARDGAADEKGLIRITCVRPFGLRLVVPLLESFLPKHPKIDIELELEDRVQDLVREGYDIGIRVGRIKPENVIAREIAPMAFVVCGAPSYFERRGEPRTVADLAHHNCLRLRGSSTAQRAAAQPWALPGKPSDSSVAPRGNFVATDFLALEQAAVSGLGLYYGPLPLVMPHFRSGALRPVLPELLHAPLSIYLYYRSRQHQSSRRRVLIEALLDLLRQHPDLATPPEALCAPYWSEPKRSGKSGRPKK